MNRKSVPITQLAFTFIYTGNLLTDFPNNASLTHVNFISACLSI